MPVISESDYLAHYGVKGMKWRNRKEKRIDGEEDKHAKNRIGPLSEESDPSVQITEKIGDTLHVFNSLRANKSMSFGEQFVTGIVREIGRQVARTGLVQNVYARNRARDQARYRRQRRNDAMRGKFKPNNKNQRTHR